MKSDLVRRLTPEEEELAAKREELARLEAQLIVIILPVVINQITMTSDGNHNGMV